MNDYKAPATEEMNKVLLQALRDCVKALNIAFDADVGDVFGFHHNDAVDALTTAETLIKHYDKPERDA